MSLLLLLIPSKSWMGASRGWRLARLIASGGWQACFAWSDVLMCSHEVHLLLANMGIVDWRPCLNVWAGMECITKYATKVPSGSCKMSDVLKDAVAYSGMPLRVLSGPAGLGCTPPVAVWHSKTPLGTPTGDPTGDCLAFENSVWHFEDSNLWGLHWGEGSGKGIRISDLWSAHCLQNVCHLRN